MPNDDVNDDVNDDILANLSHFGWVERFCLI